MLYQEALDTGLVGNELQGRRYVFGRLLYLLTVKELPKLH